MKDFISKRGWHKKTQKDLVDKIIIAKTGEPGLGMTYRAVALDDNSVIKHYEEVKKRRSFVG